jgi:hypothetical protein
MRDDLSATLLAAQEKGTAPGLAKLVLTSGETVYTFYNEGTGRLLKLVHPEKTDSYTAVALLDNHDNYFTEKDLRGYTATISWGYRTSAGDEYSASAPLQVVAMQPISYPGRLMCYIAMDSVVDKMAGEQSNVNYNLGYVGCPEANLAWAADGAASAGANVIDLLAMYLTVSTAEISQKTRFTVAGDETVYTLLTTATINNKTRWTAEIGKGEGDIVIPTEGNEDGCCYKCTVAGTTGTVEPNWTGITFDEDGNYVSGYLGTVTDGTVTWQNTGARVTVAFTPVLAGNVAENTVVTFYSPGSVDSPKDHINAICAKTMLGFTPYTAITTSWDSEDDLIDTLVFKDSFRIYDNSSTRKERIDWLIRWTKEVYRWEADGKLHFINPTVSGEVYDYTYAISGDHPFFSKTYVNTIVNPNSVAIEAIDEGIGTGGATDASYATRLHWRKYIFPTITMAQGNAIAQAVIQRAQVDSQGGTVTVPLMNVGQEVWDYVKITDAREGGVARTGNIQKLVRTWDGIAKEHRFDMTITFGGSGNIPTGNAIANAKDATAEAIQSSARYVSDASTSLSLELNTILLDLINQVAESLIELSKRMDNITGTNDGVADTNIITDKLTVNRECIVPAPVLGTHAVTKDYVDSSIVGGTGSIVRIVELLALPSAVDLTTGDGKLYFFIPDDLDGYVLIDADACVNTVSSSGTPTVQIHNLTDTVDMLSTRITLDINEKTSYTAATQPVINTDYDDVATGDELRIDVDVAGTGTKGLIVILIFQLP